MKIFEFRSIKFSPSVTMILLTLVTVSLLSALAYWQLRRAEEKRHILHAYKLMQHKAPQALQDAASLTNYQRVTVEGSYDNQHQLLLDNQYHDHHLGYEILTPLLLNNGKLLLVDRGWVQADSNRAILPSLAPIEGQQTLLGTVYFPTHSIVLGNMIDGPTRWPLRIEKIELRPLSALLGKSIYPATLRLDPSQKYGFVRDWKLVIMMPSRHIGYAIQWFSMALVVVIIFFGLNFERNHETAS